MDCSNQILEIGPEVVQPPKYQDVIGSKSEEEYLTRINDLETPRERLVTLFKSIIDPYSEATHEAAWIRKIALASASFGVLLGGIINSKDYTENYIRKHNASIFDNKHVGQRHYWDSFLMNIAGRGIKTGFRTFLLVTSANLIAVGSITYRNNLYLPDFVLGVGALGGISRLWLGPRAVLVGCGMGVAAGLLGYGVVKVGELAMGESITRFRLIEHRNWLDKREAKQRRFHRIQEEEFMKINRIE